MLVIRFLRVGKKNQPSFKIVVVDKRKSSKSGSFIEEVGFYNPLTKEKVLKAERIKYWLSVGVQPSPTVHNLLVKEKILEGKKKPKHKKAKVKEEKPSFAKATEGKEPASAEAMEGKEKPEEIKPTPEVKTEEKPAEKKKVEIPKKVESPKKEKKTEKTEPQKETKVSEEGKPEAK